MLARGRDAWGHFELLPEPPALTLDEAVAAQQAAAAHLIGSLRKTTGHYAADEPR